MTDPLLTVKEVAARLQVSPEQVRRLIRAGDLPSVDLGPRTVRIRPADLEDFLGG